MSAILVVDDDVKITRIIAKYLTSAGYQPTEAHSGQQALDMLQQTPYSLLVLDVLLPDCSGLELCGRLRVQGSDIPVLMLSALGLTDDIIAGLRRGADDYLVKPFEPRELVERVGALLRRYHPGVHFTSRQPLGDLELDRAGEAVYHQGRQLELSRREYALLVHLADNSGRVQNRQQLLDAVWGWDYDGSDRAVDLCVLRLRSKLQAAGLTRLCIDTIWGTGYKLVEKG